MNKYNCICSISFKEYCENNGIETPSDDMISKWRKEIIENVRNGRLDITMNLFKIPNKYKNYIEFHNFKLEESNYYVSNEKKNLSVSIQLTLTD